MMVLGIDIGSSAIKGVVLDGERVVRSLRVPMPPRLDVGDPLKFEHDPLAVCDAAFALIRELVAGQQIERIAFTGQMHGGLVTDRDLNPITNIVTWQDRRNNDTLETLRASIGEDPTGVGIHPGFLIATVADWNSNGALRSDGYVIGIYDWIASLLVQRAITDVASAAAWGMYDPVKKQWRQSVLGVAGAQLDSLPEVFEPGSPIGEIDSSIAAQIGLTPGTQLYAGTGDTQATYLGSGCLNGDLLLNFGTGSQSIWETNPPIKSEGVDIRYLTNGRWLATSPTEAGGEAYRILGEFVRDVVTEVLGDAPPIEIIYERLNAIAIHSEANGVEFEPAFAGSKVRNADAAFISGLTKDNFRLSNIAAALLAGMVREIAAPYFVRERQPPKRLVGSGTAMHRNPALRKAAEKFFKTLLLLPENEEDAAFGVAKLCLLQEKGA
jgi:sugar (pentulose or hexulose) kinase